jgi:hypothetical protein
MAEAIKGLKKQFELYIPLLFMIPPFLNRFCQYGSIIYVSGGLYGTSLYLVTKAIDFSAARHTG